MRAAAPGRLPPESAGVHAVQADAGRLGAAALTPKQGPTRRETRRVFVPSKPTQVGLEPRHAPLSGNRSTYPTIGGLS